MNPLKLSHIARVLNLSASWLLVAGVALAAADIATARPGMWDLIPRFAEPLLLWAPLYLAVSSLALTGAASLRGELGATRIKGWFTSALIAFLYAFIFIWHLIFPMRLY
jgi:hypothetical protein